MTYESTTLHSLSEHPSHVQTYKGPGLQLPLVVQCLHFISTAMHTKAAPSISKR